MPRYFLSIDVEDWFHSHNLRSQVDWGNWDSYELRVRQNTERILDILEAYDTQATFFVLTWVAERCPELVRRIDRAGHEVASHGHGHELLSELSEEEIRADIKRSVNILSSLVERPIGYRAPSFTISPTVLDILDEVGFTYDSSYVPTSRHDRYGDLDEQGNSTIYKLGNGLTEFRLPTVDFVGMNIPWGGGGYFRTIPYQIYHRGVARLSKTDDFVFYIHPWEFDSDQPRLNGIPWDKRFRHYHNLEKTEGRFKQLLQEFDWIPLNEGL